MAMQAVAQPGNDLSTFAITPERGFLPPVDPLRELPRALDAWEKIAAISGDGAATGAVRLAEGPFLRRS